MALRKPIAQADDLDVLSAIWILSCNDENPMIFYEGIQRRLGLPTEVNIRALVQSRRELFRPKVSESGLQKWKSLVKDHKKPVPEFIDNSADEATTFKAIDAISRDDAFINQFRVRDNAETCSIDLIDWGLKHIDRLRTSVAEEAESKTKFFGTVIIPIVSLFIAFCSIAVSGYLQFKSMNEQNYLKMYEISFKPKQEAYTKS
jgi:hypothetical protein